jgi:glyoxylase-like metal-dependent hydrolase (beta-lactamase superfamily II)
MLMHEYLGIYQVRLPLPFRLNHVNCYAFRGKDGWSLVDSGLSNEATYEGWRQFFQKHSLKPSDIKGIYITHFHPDHYGCSGWLQKLTTAPVFIGAIDANRVSRYWKNGDYILGTMGSLFRTNGMPADVVREAIASLGRMIPYTQPPAKLTALQAGETVILGDHEYQVILTPGHSDGHICFHNAKRSLLISGDHLLPEITSNVSRWPQPDADPDPLDNFLYSINSIRRFPCELALPAHGKPFQNVEERIRQLEIHHKERLELIWYHTGSGSTAYQVCQRVFSQDLSFHEIRFALTETLAHLVYLFYRGKLKLDSSGGVDIYYQVKK